MKIIYSEIKRFLPGLNKSARGLADDLTMLGHFADSISQLGDQTVISLEVRQNRGDCLGYYGLARDLAAFYNLPLKIESPQITYGSLDLPVEVRAPQLVNRLMAVQIEDLKNSASPQWLAGFLRLHDINSVNTLVDLTNYVMLIYGIPCHAFDLAKTGQKLIWETAEGHKNFTTFDGSQVGLTKNALMISNGRQPLALSMIGAADSGIDLSTRGTVIEMAIYDRVRVRRDCQQLKILTEAGNRLEKELDPETIPLSFSNLVNLVRQECRGRVTSSLFDYYPQPQPPAPIILNPARVSRYAGVDISPEFSTAVLSRLGAVVTPSGHDLLSVTPPTIRKDITLEEDLIEEVIRFYGYDKIPTDQPINNRKYNDITPHTIYLSHHLKNMLVSKGYDEVRNWPLIETKYHLVNPKLTPAGKPVKTQNNINEHFPLLRQSLISSLIWQREQWRRFKIPTTKFFEVGKIFHRDRSGYHEIFTLGIANPSSKNLKTDLASVGDYWLLEKDGFSYAEVNLDQFSTSVIVAKDLLDTPPQTNSIVEMSSQLIDLDINLTLPQDSNPSTVLEQYAAKIGPDKLWQIEIRDAFAAKNKRTKFTLRVYYYGMTAQKAKTLHQRIFKPLLA